MFLDKLFHRKTGLICPRCERSMEGHDNQECKRRISRRYFFGLAAGAVAGLVVAESLPIWEPSVGGLTGWSVEITPGPSFITTAQIAHETLEILKRNLAMTNELFKQYDYEFSKGIEVGSIYAIGTTPDIRAPRNRYRDGSVNDSLRDIPISVDRNVYT